MVVNQVPFEVKIDPQGSDIDITKYVTSIDNCVFQGTGKIRIASMMLEALEGAFITNTNSGATPQINEFEKIEITWQDLNENIKRAVFEVDVELPQKVMGGVTLPLELKGRERALQDMLQPCYFEFVNPFFMLNFLAKSYNDNRGTNQPDLTLAYVNVEPLLAVKMIFDFASGWTYYDAMMHVIERVNAPTAAGGTGNFYSLISQDNALDDGITLTIKVQGSGTSPPTIKSTITDPTHSLTARIDSTKATQVFVRGMAGAGSVPNGFHQFSSYIEEINNYPGYNASAVYEVGMRVISAGTIYQANTQTSNAPPHADWTATTAATIIGSVQYSEWTNNKATVTKNSCSNPTNGFLASGFDSPAFPDGNLVVRETWYFRDFVHIRAIDDTTIYLDSTNKFYLRGQAQTGLYRGFRLLVDTSLGNPDGSFGDGAGTIYNDRFGRSYDDAMVIYTGTEWIVIREPVAPTPGDKNIDHCAVLSEGKVYEFNAAPGAGGDRQIAIRKSGVFRGGSSSGPFAWRAFHGSSFTNDVFHHPKNIESVTGLITPEIKANQDISSYLTNSGIKITYEFSLTQPIIEVVQKIGGFIDTVSDTINDIWNSDPADTIEPTTNELNDAATTGFYDIGWWYALPFPYPLSEFNTISEDVGDLYGLGTDPNGINNEFFGTLDIQNSTFSHQGKFGFNHDQVQDMGSPFTALGFLFNFDVVVSGVSQPLKGDIPFTVTIYDDLSQVWRADFQYRFLGDTQEITMPFSSFTVNRPSRNPWAIDTVLMNLIHTPELEIRSIFQERRVRLITWQLKTSYDDNERYMPFNVNNVISVLFGLGTVDFIGTIDAIHLKKQPFVSSGTQSARVVNPRIIEAPNTRNLRQLIGIADAEVQKQGHKYEAYNYIQDIRCDLEDEQSVYLEDKDIVKFADRNETSPGANDGDPNTRKCVVLEQNFTYNAEGKQSGALLDLTLVKRLEV